MLIPIQTYWSTSDPSGGWIHRRFGYFSWALSTFLLDKYVGPVVLHTDAAGAEELCADLQLPFSRVVLSVTDHGQMFDRAWVLKKLHTYSIQDQPFIHVDGDAFIFSSLASSIHASELVVQNIEFDHPYYLNARKIVLDSFNYIPDFLAINSAGSAWAVNAGLIGGHNLKFFKELYEEALTFLRRNEALIAKLASVELNTYLEQYMFKCLADFRQIPILTLLDRQIGFPYNYGLDKFISLPSGINYLHVMNYKLNPTICEQVAQRLWLESPELYERCERAVEKKLAGRSVFFDSPTVCRFPRLSEALISRFQMTNSEVGLLLGSEDAFFQYIEPAGIEAEILKDLYFFESAKESFWDRLDSVGRVREEWQDWSRSTNDFLNLPFSGYLTHKISVGKYCARVASEWNWCEANEFSNQGTGNTYASNRLLSAGYFETLFYYSYQLNCIRELLLDPINILLLDEIDKPEEINSILDRVELRISEFKGSVKSAEFMAMMDERIRFLLYAGVVNFEVAT